MRRLTTFKHNGKSMLQPKTILSVRQILEQYFTNQQIPAAMNSRPYDFESEIGPDGFAHAKGFEGDYSRVIHPDLFQAVSRESRESRAKKAALLQSQGQSVQAPVEPAPAPVEPAPAVSSTEGAGE